MTKFGEKKCTNYFHNLSFAEKILKLLRDLLVPIIMIRKNIEINCVIYNSYNLL